MKSDQTGLLSLSNDGVCKVRLNDCKHRSDQ